MRFKYLLLSLPLVVGICGTAQAQPDVNNAPKGENPPNWNWNPGGRVGNRRTLPQRLTPEQTRRLREQRTELRAQDLKQRLTRAGFTDEALQTAVVTEFKVQDTSQRDLLGKWQKITQALRVNQTPATEVAVMNKEFRDAMDKEKARRAAAATALEAQFQISQKPVLDALLMTLGITGDEAGFVGQITGNGLNQIAPLPTMVNGIIPMEKDAPYRLPNGGVLVRGELNKD